MKAVLAGVCLLVAAGLANITYWEADADAEVRSYSPDGEFGHSDYLSVWMDEDDEVEYRSFIHFDLSNIHPHTFIEYGLLRLHLYWTGFESGMLAAYKVTDSWEESTITWNNQPAYDLEKVLFYDWIQWAEEVELELDGSVIQEWVDNPSDNYGMILVVANLFYPHWQDLAFMSRETDDGPLLELHPDPFPVESLSWGMIKVTEW
ncbi:DNRLRE domain-containing protein [bacterium]|nr:DNRLRE domain-containing protein [bacterium]